jgi:hypothetical protein
VGEDIETFHKPLKESKRARTRRAWAAKKDADVALREEVLMRSHGDCEIRSAVCTGRVEVVHHVLRRGQGGAYDLDLVRGSCVACHEHLHGHVAEALERGWLIEGAIGRAVSNGGGPSGGITNGQGTETQSPAGPHLIARCPLCGRPVDDEEHGPYGCPRAASNGDPTAPEAAS